MLTFGRYRLRELLGEGGFRVVYGACDTLLEREVALKQLRSELAAAEDTRRRFLRKAHTLARLRHRHTAGIDDVGEERGLPYLTMELIQGATLASLLLRGGPQPLARVAARSRWINRSILAPDTTPISDPVAIGRCIDAGVFAGAAGVVDDDVVITSPTDGQRAGGLTLAIPAAGAR